MSVDSDGQPSALRASDGCDGGGRRYVERAGESLRQPLHPTAESVEDRRVRRWRPPSLGSQAEDEAAVEAVGGREIGGDGCQAQPVGSTGVDAADEGVDQALEHLAAEAGLDDLGDRRVGLQPALGEHHVEGGPRHASGAHDARSGEGR